MLFTSATLNDQSMYYISMMLHPSSPWKSAAMFNRFCGLDVPDIELLSKIKIPFWDAIIWGSIAREGIDIQLNFSSHWLKSIGNWIKCYVQRGCKVLVYCSSASDAREKVAVSLNEFLLNTPWKEMQSP